MELINIETICNIIMLYPVALPSNVHIIPSWEDGVGVGVGDREGRSQNSELPALSSFSLNDLFHERVKIGIPCDVM